MPIRLHLAVEYSKDKGSASFTMRARLLVSVADKDGGASSGAKWDVALPLDLGQHLRLGSAKLISIGVVGSMIRADNRVVLDPATVLLHSVCVESISLAAAYPSASPFTAARFPDTCTRLQKEIDGIRAWMGLSLEVQLPPLFRTVFNSEAVSSYQRLFSSTIKVRMVALALEQLWMDRSKRTNERVFCHLSHSMHFFISNLHYYLQVSPFYLYLHHAH